MTTKTEYARIRADPVRLARKRAYAIEWYYRLRADPVRYAALLKRQKAYQKAEYDQKRIDPVWMEAKRTRANVTYNRMVADPMRRAAHRSRAQEVYDPVRARNYNLKKYGLTLEEWDALFASQSYCCAACGSSEPGGRNWHTDHDHATGKVRGILCHGCNSALGHIKDDLDRLRKLIEYLKNDGNKAT